MRWHWYLCCNYHTIIRLLVVRSSQSPFAAMYLGRRGGRSRKYSEWVLVTTAPRWPCCEMRHGGENEDRGFRRSKGFVLMGLAQWCGCGCQEGAYQGNPVARPSEPSARRHPQRGAAWLDTKFRTKLLTNLCQASLRVSPRWGLTWSNFGDNSWWCHHFGHRIRDNFVACRLKPAGGGRWFRHWDAGAACLFQAWLG